MSSQATHASDCKEYGTRIENLERRQSATDAQVSAIAVELKAISNMQTLYCAELKDAKTAILSEIKEVKVTQTAMQIDNATISERMRSDKEHIKDTKAENKWWVELLLKLTPYGGALAVIYYASSKILN
mgnify:CR=1 FL=1